MKSKLLILIFAYTSIVFGQEKDFYLERNDSLLKTLNFQLSYELHFALTSPKYQNPFSPSDNHYIIFVINDTSSVSLRIYKKNKLLLGNINKKDSLEYSEINYFFKNFVEPGEYKIYWRGLDSNKNYVEKGFYIYEFEIRPLKSIFKYPEIYIRDEWMH